MAANDQISIIGAYDAKARLSELLERVAKGEEVVITRHGTPVARLVPIKKSATAEARRAAIERWRQTSRELSLAGLKLRDLTDEGRP